MFGFLAFLAQYGRFVLVAGLISGLALPDGAELTDAVIDQVLSHLDEIGV